MPKQKTRKVVKKRFKITKTGKVMHRRHGARHLRRKKSKSRQRRQDREVAVKSKKQARVIRNFLQS